MRVTGQLPPLSLENFLAYITYPANVQFFYTYMQLTYGVIFFF